VEKFDVETLNCNGSTFADIAKFAY